MPVEVYLKWDGTRLDFSKGDRNGDLWCNADVAEADKAPPDEPMPKASITHSDEPKAPSTVLAMPRAKAKILSVDAVFAPIQDHCLVKVSLKNPSKIGALILQVFDRDGALVYAEGLTQKQVWGLPKIWPSGPAPLGDAVGDDADKRKDKATKRAARLWVDWSGGPYRVRVVIMTQKITAKGTPSAFAALQHPRAADSDQPRGFHVSSTVKARDGAPRLDETEIQIVGVKVGLGRHFGKKRAKELDDLVNGKKDSFGSADAANPDVVEWVRATLNQLGFFAGPLRPTVSGRDELPSAVARFRLSRPKLWAPSYRAFEPSRAELKELADYLVPCDEQGLFAVDEFRRLYARMRSKISGDRMLAEDARRSKLEQIDGAIRELEDFARTVLVPERGKLEAIDGDFIKELLAAKAKAAPDAVLDKPDAEDLSIFARKIRLDLSRFYVGDKTEFGVNDLYETEPDDVRAASRKAQVESTWLGRPILPLRAIVSIRGRLGGDGPALHPSIVAGLNVVWSCASRHEETGSGSFLPMYSESRPFRSHDYFVKVKSQLALEEANAPAKVQGVPAGVEAFAELPPYGFDVDGRNAVVTRTVGLADQDPVEDAHSGVFLRTSTIAGDSYVVKAELRFRVPPAYAVERKPRGFESGRMTVWRRVRVACHVEWGDDRKKAIPWTDVAGAYAHAFIELEPPAKTMRVGELNLKAAFEGSQGKGKRPVDFTESAFLGDVSKRMNALEAVSPLDHPHEIAHNLVVATVKREIAANRVEAEPGKEPPTTVLEGISRIVETWKGDSDAWVQAAGRHFATELAKFGAMKGGRFIFKDDVAPETTIAEFTTADGRTRLELLQLLLFPSKARAAFADWKRGQLKSNPLAQTLCARAGNELARAYKALRTPMPTHVSAESRCDPLLSSAEGPFDKANLYLRKITQTDVTAIVDEVSDLKSKVNELREAIRAIAVTDWDGRRAGVERDARALSDRIGAAIGQVDALRDRFLAGQISPVGPDDERYLRQIFDSVGVLAKITAEAQVTLYHPLVTEVAAQLGKFGDKMGVSTGIGESMTAWKAYGGQLVVETDAGDVRPIPTGPVEGPQPTINKASKMNGRLLEHFDRVVPLKGGNTTTLTCSGLKGGRDLETVKRLLEENSYAQGGFRDLLRIKTRPTWVDQSFDIVATLPPEKTEEELHKAYREQAVRKAKLAVMGAVADFIAEVTDGLGPKLDGIVRNKLKDADLRTDGLVVVDFAAHKPVKISDDETQYYIAPASLGKSAGVTFVARGMPIQLYQLVAHEMGHCMFMRHWEKGRPGIKPGHSVPLDHDQGDHACIMSYPVIDFPEDCPTTYLYHPDRYAPQFCGKCNLKLRGWDIRAQDSSRDLLPPVSVGAVNLNSGAPIHPFKVTDPARSPAELPDATVVMSHLENLLVELELVPGLGDAQAAWTRRPDEAGAIGVAANPIWLVEGGQEKVQFQAWPTLAVPGNGRPRPPTPNPMVKQTWFKALDDFATLGGFAAGTLGTADYSMTLNANFWYADFTDLIHESCHFVQNWSATMPMQEGVVDLFAAILGERMAAETGQRRFRYAWNPSYAESVLYAIDQWLPRLGLGDLLGRLLIKGDRGALDNRLKPGRYDAVDAGLAKMGGAGEMAQTQDQLYLDPVEEAPIWDGAKVRPDIERALGTARGARHVVQAIRSFAEFLEGQRSVIAPPRLKGVPASGNQRSYRLAYWARVTRKHAAYTDAYLTAIQFQKLGYRPDGLDKYLADSRQQLEALAKEGGVTVSVELGHAPKGSGYFSRAEDDPRQG